MFTAKNSNQKVAGLIPKNESQEPLFLRARHFTNSIVPSIVAINKVFIILFIFSVKSFPLYQKPAVKKQTRESGVYGEK